MVGKVEQLKDKLTSNYHYTNECISMVLFAELPIVGSLNIVRL